jgi:hypothetical protein
MKQMNLAERMKVVNAGLLATSFMTLFSYAYSFLSKDNTKEPQLLGKLIRRLRPGIPKRAAGVAGWAAHYGVGLLFAELYGRIWERTAINVNARSGLVFGGLSGIAAILIWKFTFAIHPFAPAVNFTSFALNLFLAHLVFGLFAAIGYR